MDKKTLRKILEEKRDSFDIYEREKFNKDIEKHLFSSKIYKESKTIFTYVSISSEVNTINICRKILDDGKTLLIPKINMENKTMDSVILNSLDDLIEMEFNIPSTDNGIIYNGEIDLVLVPLLGININGYRLGYGGGYYDKFLKNRHAKNTVALSYSFQITNNIPIDKWDVQLNYILNENGLKRIEEQNGKKNRN